MPCRPGDGAAGQEYEAFAGRDLSEFSVAYLFVDGDGQKVLLHLAPGTRRTRQAARPSSRISSAAG